MVYKVPVRLPLCEFLYKMRTCLCFYGVTIHRAVWVLHSSQLPPFSSSCTPWRTSSIIFLFKTSCSFFLLISTVTPLQGIHCLLWVDTESGQEKMQVKKQRSQISIPGSLRKFVASHRPPLLVSIMADLSNKAALPVEGHSSPAPGTLWGRCEDKRQ